MTRHTCRITPIKLYCEALELDSEDWIMIIIIIILMLLIIIIIICKLIGRKNILDKITVFFVEGYGAAMLFSGE